MNKLTPEQAQDALAKLDRIDAAHRQRAVLLYELRFHFLLVAQGIDPSEVIGHYTDEGTLTKRCVDLEIKVRRARMNGDIEGAEWRIPEWFGLAGYSPLGRTVRSTERVVTHVVMRGGERRVELVEPLRRPGAIK